MTSIRRHSSSVLLCRVCAENRPEMLPIFSELDGGPIIASVIAECSAVQILEDDGLSESICSDCVGEVKFIIRFIDKTRRSDRLLRKMFKTEMKEEEEQLYALEISVLDHPEHVDIKNEPIDEEQEEMIESDLNVEFDDGNDSDYLAENKSDSDEDYQPKRPKMTSDDNASVPKKTEAKWIDDLDEIEKNTFTIVDVDDKLICCTCYKLFDSEDELTSHGKSIHEANRNFKASKKHVCRYCFRRYASLVALKAHYKQVKSITKVFDCRICQARFTASPKRRHHAHKHPPLVPKSSIIVAPIPVEILDECGKICCAQGCTQVFDSEEELLAHSVNAHKANRVQSSLSTKHRPVECQICYRRFIDENGLKAHQQRIYMPKRHVCSICGLKFAQPGECKRHERDHQNVDKTFKCEQCPKSYINMDLLKAHVKRHSATREFMCNICGQSYLQKHNLMGHMLMHEGKLPFECDICKKAFRVKAKMIYHKRVHSGERPYPCRYCNMAFADSTNRLRHEMSHTGVKPYKCDYCEKTFITKRLKKEHENTHASRNQKGKHKSESL
ncbi:zinc finger protein OZF-like [Ochlerotatus camptorhynchus]|uniref:zinc finger protein OZF-like n=1 Tax=Ochlerotatus camptorhynchus TaxID=644619 RepID=UPI0031CF7538